MMGTREFKENYLIRTFAISEDFLKYALLTKNNQMMGLHGSGKFPKMQKKEICFPKVDTQKASLEENICKTICNTGV